MNLVYKKSGPIPRFGDWDNANELPITQYFECARQADLVPYSVSSLEQDQYPTNAYGYYGDGGGRGGDRDLNAGGYGKPSVPAGYAPAQKIHRTGGSDVVKDRCRQFKICNANEMDQSKYRKPLSRKQLPKPIDKESTDLGPVKTVKPVDEDLYEVPRDLLQKSQRKKMLGFLSRCLAPPCKI